MPLANRVGGGASYDLARGHLLRQLLSVSLASPEGTITPMALLYRPLDVCLIACASGSSITCCQAVPLHRTKVTAEPKQSHVGCVYPCVSGCAENTTVFSLHLHLIVGVSRKREKKEGEEKVLHPVCEHTHTHLLTLLGIPHRGNIT